jgi:hypothetical protein
MATGYARTTRRNGSSVPWADDRPLQRQATPYAYLFPLTTPGLCDPGDGRGRAGRPGRRSSDRRRPPTADGRLGLRVGPIYRFGFDGRAC